MSQLHRLQWIDREIRDQRYPNCSRIAQEFCISVRQASRDIEYLRYSLHAPIEFFPDKNGYAYTDTRFILPNIFIQPDEKKALQFLIDQYQQQDNPMAGQLADLFSNLIGQKVIADSREKKPLSPWELRGLAHTLTEREIEIYHQLKNALQQTRVTGIIYYDQSNQLSRRIIHPYSFMIQMRHCYLVAFCELRQDIRTFRLSRIKRIKLLDREYPLPKDLDQVVAQHRRLGFDWRKPYRVVLELDSPMKESDLERFRAFKPELMDERHYRFSFFRSAEILDKLIGWDRNFTILEPDWLKTRLKTKILKILEKNS